MPARPRIGGDVLVRLNAASVSSKVLTYCQKNAGPVSLAMLSQELGESQRQVLIALTLMRQNFANVVVRHKKDEENVGVVYYPVAPEEKEVVVVQASTSAKVADAVQQAVNLSQPPAVPAALTVPQAARTRATDIVWSSQPDIPNIGKKYSFFIKPWYFDHMTKKVTVYSRHVRVFGPPGIGKSTSFEVLAASLNIPLVNVPAEAGLRGRQLVGGMTDLGRFEVAQFATAVFKGWWAKIDEANAMDADASLFLNSILAPPYMITVNGTQYPVHRNFRLCLTYNPGLLGTKPVPESLADRFYPFAVWFPDKPTLNRMLKGNQVDIAHPEVVKLSRFSLELASERRLGHHRYDITLRRLVDAWTDIQDGLPMVKAVDYAIISGIDNAADRTFASNIAKRVDADRTVYPDDSLVDPGLPAQGGITSPGTSSF